MSPANDAPDPVEELWRTFLTYGYNAGEKRQKRFFAFLPADHRCKFCAAPFDGPGASLVRTIFDKRPSNMNPNLCTICEQFARKYQGGAEIDLTMLFIDVRGSTPLAESMSAAEFSRLINRFYRVATGILIQTDAFIDKLVGDQVVGLYVPGLAGTTHAAAAINAAREVMQAVGHSDPGGPWLPLGAGVHTGRAFVGAVGSRDGTTDITVLGDAANTAARLSSSAGPGEILISQAAYEAAGLPLEGSEPRLLNLKGKSKPVAVRVFRPSS
jgi:adenylate cyclase